MNKEKMIFKTHKQLIKTYARTLLNFDLLMDAPLMDGPKIIAANHPTTTDPFLLPLLVDDPIHILVTEMAFEVPLLGSAMRQAGHIPVSRTPGQGTGIIQQAVDRLDAGGTIGIFPEGSLSPRVGQFCQPRTGAARIALQSGVPVIPVGIHLDTNGYIEKTFNTDSFSDTSRWACRGRYYLSVGQPLQFEGSAEDRPHVRQVSTQIMEAIQVQARRSQARMDTTHITWQPLFRRFARQGGV